MYNPPRTIGFILAATDQGSLIVNRFDYHLRSPTDGFGVGHSLLRDSQYEAEFGRVVSQLLNLRRQYFGDGVRVIDCGANIGVHTIEWARQMTGWGSVLAIEAQERIYYALAGNIALNNCFNARALHVAAGATAGRMRIPTIDYLAAASFGSLELKPLESPEYIGQAIDYAAPDLADVELVPLDSLQLPRIDLLKIDVEGMELDVLQGAVDSIARCHPIIIVEHLKSPKQLIASLLQSHGYQVRGFGMNYLAIAGDDPTERHIENAPASAAPSAAS